MIGQTRDDAAGEAFDKVSKALGFGFPGGPTVERLALAWKGPYRGIFPTVLLDEGSLDFSFSGLKSAVKREIDKRKLQNGALTEADHEEIAFEFSHAILETLVTKLFRAAHMHGISSVVLAG